jgi:hypothetical protein
MQVCVLWLFRFAVPLLYASLQDPSDTDLNTWLCDNYRYVSTRTNAQCNEQPTDQLNNKRTDYVVFTPDPSKLLK